MPVQVKSGFWLLRPRRGVGPQVPGSCQALKLGHLSPIAVAPLAIYFKQTRSGATGDEVRRVFSRR